MRKAKQQGRDWLMADLNGLALTGPGHEPWNFMLRPQEGDATAQALDAAAFLQASPAAGAPLTPLESTQEDRFR